MATERLEALAEAEAKFLDRVNLAAFQRRIAGNVPLSSYPHGGKVWKPGHTLHQNGEPEHGVAVAAWSKLSLPDRSKTAVRIESMCT